MIEKDPQNHSSHECPPYQFYGVRKGKAVRACVFLFWSDCKAQVDGYDGAEYAGPFGDFHDAVIFAAMRQSKDNSISCTSSLSVKSDLTINTKEEKVEKIEADANKVSLPMIRVTEEDKSNSGDGTTSAKKKIKSDFS
uniref:Ribonuclease H1 N-terminal domain-containing protein n=1 Tax=Corethron hystrix TaxID=216773 RepID=A0A7S1BP33_9STRA|mmetsp:Transcript_35944/g.83866  ORF Transcript_35944/g.83866 Transcript_35944/m.83866 type:complete len:138 (+) Transcript_35944:284-697(+)